MVLPGWFGLKNSVGDFLGLIAFFESFFIYKNSLLNFPNSFFQPGRSLAKTGSELAPEKCSQAAKHLNPLNPSI